MYHILLVVKSLHSSRDCWTCSRLCVRTLHVSLAWSFSRWSDSSACSARTQGTMKTGHAPDESPVSVRSDNTHIMGIRFGAMGPWSHPYSMMDLVRVGEFVLAYLPNPTRYGHETSSQLKVICYLQFITCNWTGDQQCTVICQASSPPFHSVLSTALCEWLVKLYKSVSKS